MVYLFSETGVFNEVPYPQKFHWLNRRVFSFPVPLWWVTAKGVGSCFYSCCLWWVKENVLSFGKILSPEHRELQLCAHIWSLVPCKAEKRAGVNRKRHCAHPELSIELDNGRTVTAYACCGCPSTITHSHSTSNTLMHCTGRRSTR